MTELTIKSEVDGLALAAMYEEPSKASTEASVQVPRGIVQLVHGMCEHKERYKEFMAYLASEGFVAIIHDQRGHGASVLSQRDLGYFGKDGWMAMVEDVLTVGKWAKKKWPGLPLVLFGHSMGSMVVRSFTKRYDSEIDGLVVCGCPSDNPAKGAGAFLAKLTGILRGSHYRPHFLQKMSFGAYNKPFKDEGYAAAWVCSNKEVLEAYHKDPLCQFIFTADGFHNLLKLMQDCYSGKGWKVARKSLPIRFISGAEDPCGVSEEALNKAADAMRCVGYEDVSLKLYPGMRHEILNETERAIVWQESCRFCADVCLRQNP